MSIKHILVPTDFSDCAASALEVAIAIALAHKAKITVVEAISPIPQIYGLHKDEVTQQQHHELLNIEVLKINTLAQFLSESQNLEVEPLIVIDQTVVAICETAIRLNVDLIIMGTHGITGFREFVIGSNTYSVIEKSLCPVLSVPQKATDFRFDKILFPVRNIPNALEKYDFMIKMIGSDPVDIIIYGLLNGNENSRSDFRNKIKSFELMIKTQQVSTELIFTETDENYADKVIEIANDRRCNLIVITSKVKSTVEDFFLGKFAKQIVNHSTIAVLHIK